MSNYPHTSWNSAAYRAQAHRTTVAGLATQCPVEHGRNYCPVCCAVSTDTPAG